MPITSCNSLLARQQVEERIALGLIVGHLGGQLRGGVFRGIVGHQYDLSKYAR